MFCEDVRKLVTHPATKKLSELREDAKKLSEKTG